MFVMARALAARRHLRDAFAGEYLPLQTTGARQESVFAFARVRGSEYAITCVPRLIASVIPDAAGPPLGDVWLDTRVELPADAPSTFRDALSGATIDAERGAGNVSDSQTIPVAALFERLPVALLTAP